MQRRKELFMFKFILYAIFNLTVIASVYANPKSGDYYKKCVEYLNNLPDIDISYQTDSLKENLTEEEKSMCGTCRYRFVKKADSFRFDSIKEGKDGLHFTFAYHLGTFYIKMDGMLVLGSKLSDFESSYGTIFSAFPSAQKMKMHAFYHNVEIKNNGDLVALSETSIAKTKRLLSIADDHIKYKKLLIPKTVESFLFFKNKKNKYELNPVAVKVVVHFY